MGENTLGSKWVRGKRASGRRWLNPPLNRAATRLDLRTHGLVPLGGGYARPSLSIDRARSAPAVG